MRVRDLWFTARPPKRKTKRHPDLGGDKTSKRWLAVWHDPAGREHTKAFAVKNQAEAHGRKMEADAQRGEYIDPAAGNTTVDPLARKWLRLREVGTSSLRRYEQCYRLHIAPVFGQRQAGSIKPSEIAEWSRGMAGHPVTRHMAVTILTGVLDLAVDDKVRRDNPARARIVGRPQPPRRAAKPDPWDAARVLAVAEAIRSFPNAFGKLASIPLVAAGLGLRQGECFGLGLEDFDLELGVVHVRRQLARDGSAWVFKLPKGGKVRTVPLPMGVAALVTSVTTAAGNMQADGSDRGAGVTNVTLPWLAEDGEVDASTSVNLIFRDEDGVANAQHAAHLQQHPRQDRRSAVAAGGPAAANAAPEDAESLFLQGEDSREREAAANAAPVRAGANAPATKNLEAPTSSVRSGRGANAPATKNLEPISLPWLNEDGRLQPVATSVPLIFRDTDGGHLKFLTFDRQVWKPALEATGLIPPYSRKVTPPASGHGMHACRHFYSTLLLDAGVSLAAVMSFMGHSRDSVPLTIGTYGSVTPEAYERARQAVDQALFKPRLVTSDGTGTELRRAR